MLSIDRTLDDLMQVSITRMQQTLLSADTPGMITRLLLAAVNNIAKDFYSTLSTAHAMSFLSTAEGEYLDKIGFMLACQRQDGESDDNYRYRISKQTLSVAAANETAIRLAALSVDGVRDVLMMPYTFGTGSGSLYVIGQTPDVSDDTLTLVQNAVDSVKAYGSRIEVLKIKTIPLAIKMNLVFKKNTPSGEQDNTRSSVTQQIRDYINNLMPGDTFVIEKVKAMAFDTSPNVFDVGISQFSVNNRPALLVNQTAPWNARFVENPAPNSIVVA
jgi:uncharacterized phage protein gp47/JayE